MIWLLAGTATLGVAAQALVLIVPLRRIGFRYRPVWGFRGAGLGSASRVALWTFAAIGVSQLGFIVTTQVLTRAGDLLDEAGIVGRRQGCLRRGVPPVHAPALADHPLAGDRPVHPDVPGRPRRPHRRGRRRRRPRPEDARGRPAARHRGRRPARRPRGARGLPRQLGRTGRRHRRRDGPDDAGPAALRLALPRPARLLRLRGRQDALLPPARRHRRGHRRQPGRRGGPAGAHRCRRGPGPDALQHRRRRGRSVAAAPPARLTAPEVDDPAVRAPGHRLRGGCGAHRRGRLGAAPGAAAGRERQPHLGLVRRRGRRRPGRALSRGARRGTRPAGARGGPAARSGAAPGQRARRGPGGGRTP